MFSKSEVKCASVGMVAPFTRAWKDDIVPPSILVILPEHRRCVF